MKTAVSIPEPVFSAAEKLAKRLKKSRSGLYAAALKEYIARHSPDAVTESWNGIAHLLDTEEDRAWRRASLESLRRVEW